MKLIEDRYVSVRRKGNVVEVLADGRLVYRRRLASVPDAREAVLCLTSPPLPSRQVEPVDRWVQRGVDIAQNARRAARLRRYGSAFVAHAEVSP